MNTFGWVVFKTALSPSVPCAWARRTVSTLTQKDGSPKDIQTLLRHVDIKTTLGIYQQAMPESVQKTVENWERRLLE